MLQAIRSWLGVIFLLAGLLTCLALVVYSLWAFAPWAALLTLGWLFLLVSMWAYEQVKLRRNSHAEPPWHPAPYDRRRLECMAHELRRLDPNNRTASIVLDHVPAYERRKELQ